MIHLNDIFTPLNGVVSWILRSRLHWPASTMLMVVSWSGRRSGQSFSIPVGYQADGDSIIVMLSKPKSKTWWKNFHSPWPADLLIRGRHHSAMGQVLEPGSADFFAQCENTMERLPFMGSQLGRIRYDPRAGLDDEQRALLIQHAGAVRFELLD